MIHQTPRITKKLEEHSRVAEWMYYLTWLMMGKFLLAADELILIHNDDGVNDGLTPEVVVLREGEGNAIDLLGIWEIIHGDCFVCRFDGPDGFESIKDEDVDVVKNRVKKVTKFCGNIIEIEK